MIEFFFSCSGNLTLAHATILQRLRSASLLKAAAMKQREGIQFSFSSGYGDACSSSSSIVGFGFGCSFSSVTPARTRWQQRHCTAVEAVSSSARDLCFGDDLAKATVAAFIGACAARGAFSAI